MPKCIYCEKDFTIKPTGKSGGWNRQLCYDCLPEGCNETEKVKAARYYLRKRADEEKLLRGCDICGYNKSAWALEWHHFNDDKEYNPSFLLGKANKEGWELYQKEIQKCQLLCSNCHREQHERQDKYVFIKPEGTDEYEKYRLKVKETYFSTQSLQQTSKILNKDVNAIKNVLQYYNIDIVNKNAGIKVAQLDKNTEEVLAIFDSIADAARQLGKNPKGSHIGDVCNGKRKTACGYKWKFI